MGSPSSSENLSLIRQLLPSHAKMIAQAFAIDGGHRTTRMSNDVLSVGTLSAAHGQKRYGVNEFLVERQPYRLPMWLINGAGEGPTLVVTAGVHAAEYASI